MPELLSLALLCLMSTPLPAFSRRLRPTFLSALCITFVMQSACGEHPNAALPAAEDPSAIAGGDESPAALAVALRDSVMQVGDTTWARVVDPAYTSAARLRFLSSPVTWTTSDPSVATVSDDGLIAALAEGTVTITATWRGLTWSHSITVVVTEAPPAPPTPETPPPPPPPGPPQPAPPGVPDIPAGSPAELPRVYVTVPTVEGAGTVHRVRRGDRLQPVIDAAAKGDVILLEEGAVFNETIILRAKPGSGWLTIRTEGTTSPVGERVRLVDTLRFARIQTATPGTPTLRTEAAASGYWLVNVHLTVAPALTSLNTLVTLGSGGGDQNTMAKVPRDLVIDRSIVRGRPDLTLRRCISLHSAHTAIINSLVTECHEKGADSQAIGGWNGPGPYLIDNNLLEGAGQNILFGGAHPSITGLHPADMVIRRNHINKRPEWHTSKRWSIKNSVQFKHAQRVLMYHNIFENVWTDAQTGMAIAASSTNQGGGPTTWAETRDLTIIENVIRNAGRGIVLAALGPGADGQAVRASRTLIHGNVMYRLGRNSPFLGNGDPIQILSGWGHVMITENTIDGTLNSLSLPTDGNPIRVPQIEYSRNVVAFGSYGVFGSGFGNQSLNTRYLSHTFRNNCFYGIGDFSRARREHYPEPNALTGAASTTVMPGIGSGNTSITPGTGCDGLKLQAGERLGAPTSLTATLEAYVLDGRSMP